MQQERIRKPSVCGQFYPSEPRALRRLIAGFEKKTEKASDYLGCVLPHAGYVYSAKVAVETVSRLNVKEKVILLGPNHTGSGARFSIMAQGVWETPLGEIEVDSSLAKALLEKSPLLEDDIFAHLSEHSLEVELPILQYFRPDFKIVPIAFMSDDLASLKQVGEGLAQAIKEQGLRDKVLLVASSDMTHYEAQEEAEKKDKIAIQSILKMDEDGLYENIRQFGISMCGYAPVIVLLKALKILGAKKAELVSYQTSAAVTRDESSVVGYAGMVMS